MSHKSVVGHYLVFTDVFIKVVSLIEHHTMLDSSIISDLYSTTDSQSKWGGILDRLHPIVNAKSAGLIVVDTFSNNENPPNQFGITSASLPADKMEIYNKEYTKYERDIVSIGNQTPVGQMIVDPAFQDIKNISNRPDVAYSIQNFGIRDRFGVRLNDDKGWYDVIAFQYDTSRGNATAKEFSYLSPYIPHIAQSIVQGRLFDQIHLKFGAVLSMLDRVNVGMLLLQPDSTVVVMNQCSKETVDRSPHLRVTPNRKLSMSPGNARLIDEIATVAKSHTAEGNESKKYVRVGDDRSDILLIELSPLSDLHSDLEPSFHGVMALIIDPKTPININEKGLAEVYALTPAELDVAKSLGEGYSPKDLAEKRNSSPQTIKQQIKSIYMKTTSSSRTELIRRMISISLPFRD